MKRIIVEEIDPRLFLKQQLLGYRQLEKFKPYPGFNASARSYALLISAETLLRTKCADVYRAEFIKAAKHAVLVRHGVAYERAFHSCLDRYRSAKEPLSQKIVRVLDAELELGDTPEDTLALVNGFLVQCDFGSAKETIAEAAKNYCWDHGFSHNAISIVLTNLDLNAPHYKKDGSGKLVRLDAEAVAASPVRSDSRLRAEVVPSQ